MQKGKYDISVVLTAHHEGRLAHRTMRSLFRSAEYAKVKGVSTEIIVVLDKADKNTMEYFSEYNNTKILIKTVDFGDLGLSRNYGVQASSGRYVYFIDADNLFGEDWLFKAFRYLEKTNEDIIVHPEYHIGFEAKNFIWHQLSTFDSEFYLEVLIEFNYWDAVCAGDKEILLRYPYESTTQTPGFGYEDWHFNCQTLADGIEHHVVPETIHFLRVKNSGSLVAYTKQTNRVIRPTKLFDPKIFSSLLEDEKRRTDNIVHEESNSGNKIVLKNKKRKLGHLINTLKKSLYRPLPKSLKPVFYTLPIFYKVIRQFRESAKISIQHKNDLPEWLIAEWKAIHEIEPQIYPEQQVIHTLSFYSVPRSRLGGYYLKLCQLFGDKVSHVFLVPWIKRGGVDLVALNYIDALVKYNLGNDVVVIATNNTDSPWAKRLPVKTRFIEFGKICAGLSAEEQEKLLTRLLLQMRPKVVHNINSDLGYRIFVKYVSALKSISNLYANSFCKDVTEEGKSVGYPFMYLPECFDSLKAVASDNQSFLDYLHETYAFDRQRMFVHYQPVPKPQKRIYKDMAPKEYLDILWAGRMDRQKRPDIFEKIAIVCKGFPFRFHVYGSSVLDDDKFTNRLRRLKNVTYYGAYDGLSSLPTGNYDLFLYTSQWDGLPNVLLEAMSLGLPIIASNVGGISELIISEKTGFLIDPYDDVDAYVNCLQRIYNDRSRLNSIVNNAYDLIHSRHSWEIFIEDIKRFPGYVVNQGDISKD